MAIDLYSKATTDTLLAGKLSDAPSDGSTYGRKDGAWEVVSGGGGSYLPLAGGTMTGAIVFDGTSGQYISKGNFDSSRGGNYGISLVCSIGYEFNWQAGWLTTTEQGSTTPRPLYLDSLAGTTLRAWDSATSTGTEVTHLGITFSDTTTQTTAGYPNTNPDGFQTSTDVSTYVGANAYPLSGNPSGFLTSVPGKSVSTVTSNAYTLAAGDANNIVYVANGASGGFPPIAITIPDDATYSFAVGTIITLCVDNSASGGDISFVQGNPGAPAPFLVGPIVSSGISSTTSGHFFITKIAADRWLLS
jgi:hypothetical protein